MDGSGCRADICNEKLQCIAVAVAQMYALARVTAVEWQWRGYAATRSPLNAAASP